MTEDEMVGWHDRLNGHEFEQALGVDEGQKSLAYCSSWGHKELDTTEQQQHKTSYSSPLPMNNHVHISHQGT